MAGAKNFVFAAQAIHREIKAELGPPSEGLRSQGNDVVLKSLVRGTRGYIEQIANQANGAYENGWFDACAVMLRRLVETLIIEAFEAKGLASKIQSGSGDFFYLRDMISATLSEPSWNLTRGCKQALPKLKDLGDKSAHSRRYIAHKGDVSVLLPEIRIVVQELIYLAGLK